MNVYGPVSVATREIEREEGERGDTYRVNKNVLTIFCNFVVGLPIGTNRGLQ